MAPILKQIRWNQPFFVRFGLLGPPNQDQAVWFRIGAGPQQRRVHQTEDRGAGAHRHANRNDGGQIREFVASKGPARKLEIEK